MEYTNKMYLEMQKKINFKNYLKKDTVFNHPKEFLVFDKLEDSYKLWLAEYLDSKILKEYQERGTTITGSLNKDLSLISEHLFDPIAINFDKIYNIALKRNYDPEKIVNDLKKATMEFMNIKLVMMHLYEGQIYCKVAESYDMLKPITRLNWR